MNQCEADLKPGLRHPWLCHYKYPAGREAFQAWRTPYFDYAADSSGAHSAVQRHETGPPFPSDRSNTFEVV